MAAAAAAPASACRSSRASSNCMAAACASRPARGRRHHGHLPVPDRADRHSRRGRVIAASSDRAVLERFLPDETATTMLGEDLAMALRPGDVLALSGDLGAGKTTLARGLIRAHAGDPGLDVPSPTFTLVQSYDSARAGPSFRPLPAVLARRTRRTRPRRGADGRAPPSSNGRNAPAAGCPTTTLQVELVHEGDGRLARIAGERPGLRAHRALARRPRLSGGARAMARRNGAILPATPRRAPTRTSAPAAARR